MTGTFLQKGSHGNGRLMCLMGMVREGLVWTVVQYVNKYSDRSCWKTEENMLIDNVTHTLGDALISSRRDILIK